MNIKNFLKSHHLAIILALVVGAISVAPQIYVLRDPNYEGIQMFGTDAEYFYVGRVNQALHEDYSRGPFPTDPGKNYYLAPKLGERIMAVFSKIFNVRVIEINVALKFFGPALLFLILYGWLLEMFSLRLAALLAPLFVILGLNLLNPVDLLHLVFLKTGIDTFLPYTRPTSPMISSLFLFLSLWWIYRLVNTRLNLKTAILLGTLSGFSLYSYIFTGTFLVVVLGLYFLYFFAERKWEKAKYLFFALITDGIVTLPFFLNFLRARLDEDYIYTATRIGLIHTRTPIFGIWIMVGFLMLIFLWPKIYKETKHFFVILLAALVVVLNQQIITGVQMQPGHYHWFITKPLIAIILGFLVLYWFKRILLNKKWGIAIAVFLVSLFFINGIIIQVHSYSVNYPTYQENQRYALLFVFLNSTYPQEKNIWASPDLDLGYPKLSYLIQAYTHHNALMVLDNYSASQNHTRGLLFLAYRLKGINNKDIMSVLMRDKNYIASALYGVYYRDLPGSHQIPDAELQELVLGYNEFYKIPLDQVFKNMNIDLVVEDKKNNNIYLEKLPFLNKVYESDNLFVYQLKNK